MIGVDTNILARVLLDDDPAQAATARKWFAHHAARGGVAVDAIALCELVWVLRARYRIAKPEIVRALEQLLDTAGVVCLFDDQVRSALEAWRGGTGDFADYMLRERYRAAGAGRTITFDRGLAGEPGFSVLK